MGWIKEQKESTYKIFKEITDRIYWNGTPKGNSSPYEFFSDYIRDYFDVTLKQCEEICTMLRDYYKIEDFYVKK